MAFRVEHDNLLFDEVSNCFNLYDYITDCSVMPTEVCVAAR